MGVVGKARKYQNFSNTENSKHFLLWVLETRNGSLSFEVGKQRDQKNVYLRADSLPSEPPGSLVGDKSQKVIIF